MSIRATTSRTTLCSSAAVVTTPCMNNTSRVSVTHLKLNIHIDACTQLAPHRECSCCTSEVDLSIVWVGAMQLYKYIVQKMAYGEWPRMWAALRPAGRAYLAVHACDWTRDQCTSNRPTQLRECSSERPKVTCDFVILSNCGCRVSEWLTESAMVDASYREHLT